ncbi:uncharacterized protein HMPREF1541_05375 [Cyphellophora europaea CBS 101466]|uniref:Large ribosomal subunit protein mL46 n=1 Tax=Cyphellophora europaea (strain CBS 101466) TaxID=1220924 RepID=W2RRR0_CYPE1|nr:uncharacterized protein HMPREF1541_05375 [Cyphellophora europaea CBS 101466]ETN39152.1 hypothetical protein HMPREF1541_05375 [Cyphellophora europaea CBS 101466]
MAPRSRGAERLVAAFSPRTTRPSICRSCRQTLSQRTYASAAAAHATPETAPVSQLTPDEPAPGPVSQPKFTVKAGVLLARTPLITPDPHPFEKAHQLYQRRLNERLVLPFTQYFYYKRDTPAFEHWRTNKTARGGVATRDIGKYNAWTKDSWNDEVLVGDETANPDKLVEQLVGEEGRGTEFAGDSGLTNTAGLRRTTEADRLNDQRSLERSLQRTLYLLVRERTKEGKPSNWIFPSGTIAEREGVAEAAQRVLDETCGVNMNTWQVARHPVGHYAFEHASIEAPKDGEQKDDKQVQSVHDTAEDVGEKTFFIKTRIFAGQADVAQENAAWEDFAWLSKEEIQQKVHPRYWGRIKNMLADQ